MKINRKLFLILLSSLVLRLIFVKNITPFGWDQERDILVIQKMVEQRKPTLSGPVVGGDGGFLLGPLYYYVLTPAYIIMSGSPWALPATSILLDLLTILAIYYLARKAYDESTALIASTFWAVSWFAITSSFVSWNIALIPLFISAIIYCALLFRNTSDPKWLYALTFLTGISLHIHPSVVPVAPILIYLAWPKAYKPNTKTILFSFISLIIAVAPLILFELRHNWINTILFKSFLNSPSLFSYYETSIAVLNKLPLTLSLWIFGKSNLYLGVAIMVILAKYLYTFNKANRFSLYVTAIVVTNILLLIIYRDPNFAEYYFLSIIVPIILTLSLAIRSLYKSNPIIAIAMVGMVIASNLFTYKFHELRADGVKVKLEITSVISNFLPSPEVDIRYELDPGRDAGIAYLLTRQGILINEHSPNKIILQENSDPDSTIDSQEYSMKEWVRSYKILGFIVE